MARHIMLSSVCAVFATSALMADWLDDYVSLVGTTGNWDQQVAEELIAIHISADEIRIKELEKKVEVKASGLLSSLYQSGYYIEFNSAKALRSFHQHVQEFIGELPYNKKMRERFIRDLKHIAVLEEELQALRLKLPCVEDTAARIGMNAHIAAKRSEIAGYRTYVKGSFLLN